MSTPNKSNAEVEDHQTIKILRQTYEKIKALAELEKRDLLTIVELAIDLYEKGDPHGRSLLGGVQRQIESQAVRQAGRPGFSGCS